MPKSYFRSLVWVDLSYAIQIFVMHISANLSCPMPSLCHVPWYNYREHLPTYLHWLSLTSIENRSHISSPSWDYLKNHGMCDVSSTVICFSQNQLILCAEFRLRFLKNSAVIWSIMGLPEESWHVRYFEYSYLFYVIFGFGIVAFYVLVYCLKVPTRRFTNLKDILENDPILNGYR